MPAIQKLTALAQDKVTQGELAFEGEVVHFAFAGGRITGEDFQTYAEAAEADQLALGTDLLSKILVSWDITHEDGSEFPPTLENLNTVLPMIRLQLLGAVTKAATASGKDQGSFAGG